MWINISEYQISLPYITKTKSTGQELWEKFSNSIELSIFGKEKYYLKNHHRKLSKLLMGATENGDKLLSKINWGCSSIGHSGYCYNIRPKGLQL